MGGPLPSPVTATEQLLVAVHDEIVGMRADLAAARGGGRKALSGSGGRTELREPRGQQVAAHSEKPPTTDELPAPPPATKKSTGRSKT